MGEINKSNRQCCDVDIRDYATKKPWIFADFCNTTMVGFSSDATYASKKGAKCIKFDNPLDGTITLEFQIYPFMIYSLLSDGIIENSAVVAHKETIVATSDSMLAVTKATPDAGSVFVYEYGDFGGNAIDVSVSGREILGTFVVGNKYEIAYLERKFSGVRRVSFNNKKSPKHYWIQMSTLDKNENGEIIPVRLTCYKCSPIKNIELQFSSDGDPATVRIQFACLEDENKDVFDMVEITESKYGQAIYGECYYGN